MNQAKLVLRSKCTRTGKEVSTFVLDYPLEIHAELLTHRAFGRNTQSARAIPINAAIALAAGNTVMPIWTEHQKGMQGGRITNIAHINKANAIVERMLNQAIEGVRELETLGIHKQNANRYLAPFSHVRVVVTATDWDNWFNLRYEDAAKPEIFELAKAMAAEFYTSKPTPLEPGDWHTPFADPTLPLEDRKLIATSVSAQASYRKEDASIEKAHDMFTKLTSSPELHASAFEHVCRILEPGETPKGNLAGFRQYRHDVEDERNAEKVH